MKDKGRTTTLGYKDLYLFILLGIKDAVGMWDTHTHTHTDSQTDAGRQNRQLYWPITSSFDHTSLFYLQDPT